MRADVDNVQEILGRAVEAVARQTGVHFKQYQKLPDNGIAQPDAFVFLKENGQKYAVEIKKWAQNTNLGAIVNQVNQLPGQGLLVADFVNPKMAEKLREQNVQFIDAAGNAFINALPVYVYVTGNRRRIEATVITNDGAKRAFEPKGLTVVYAFLKDPELVNAPYRAIAEQTGAAVGTVGWVLNALKAGDFVRENIKGKGRRLVNCKKLLDRFVEAWPEKLRPKQYIGTFITDDPNWWKAIDINQYDALWGGEIAGAKYTDYLKPKIATVYLPENKRVQFMQDMKLRKANDWAEVENSRVEILRPFWPETNKPEKEMTDPILTYADLVATADPRNLEVAKRIFDEHIAQYCRED